MRSVSLTLGSLLLVSGLPSQYTLADSVRFVVTSDSRGDAGHALALAAINDLVGGPGEFIITPGDMDPLTTTEAQINAAFGNGFPWYPVIGNHEQEDPVDVTYLRDFYWLYLDGYVNPGPDGTTEMTYSFDAGPVHIIVLNVYWDGTTNPDADISADGDVKPALRAWVEADLAASAQPWNLLFFHEPAYPQADQQWGDARHAGDSLDKYPIRRNLFWQAMEDNGATACFTAHTHRYSSYRPLGSPVWQIDSAQARGSGQYDTFFVVEADDESITVEIYRSLLSGGFLLLETLDLTDLTPAEFASFQQDVTGYSGTVDTMVHGAYPDTDYSAAIQLNVDGEDNLQEVQALLRFEGIIGDGPDQVPPDARVTSAALEFYTTNPTDDEVQFHRMLMPWEDTDTWNTLNDGLSNDGIEAGSYFDGVFPADEDSGVWHTIDVTASLEAWVTYGDANHGWVLLPTGSNGWDFYSSESSYPPQLSVEFDARPLRVARFQQGVSGYVGNVDTKLRGASPDNAYGTDTTLAVDGEDYDHETQALVSFQDIVGNDPDQIPELATIVSAKLRFYTANPTTNNSVMFHRMLVDWQDTDTWNSMVDGISADGSEAVIAPDIHLPPDNRDTWWHEVDVTASLQAWVEGGESNFGWALLPTGSNGWQFRSAESSEPPQLVVWYQIIGDLNCDGAIDGFDIDPFVLVMAGPPPYSDYYALYPDCDHTLADINEDGAIDGFDIDPFVALLGG